MKTVRRIVNIAGFLLGFPPTRFMIIALALVIAVNAAWGASFPYANWTQEGGSYSTQLVVVNPTSEPILFPVHGPRWPAVPIQPDGKAVLDGWGGEGGGVASIAIPEGLDAYVRICDPNGVQTAPIRDLGPARESARFLDLLSERERPVEGGWASYLFLYSVQGSTVTLNPGEADEREIYLAPGETQLLPVQGVVKVVNGGQWPSAGPFFAFALNVKQPRGELFADPGY